MEFDGRDALRQRLAASLGLREKLAALAKYKALALALARRYRPDLALDLLGGNVIAPPDDLSLRAVAHDGAAIRSPEEGETGGTDRRTSAAALVRDDSATGPVSLPGEAPAAERGRRAAAEAVRP